MAWQGPYGSPIPAIHMIHIRSGQTGKILLFWIGNSYTNAGAASPQSTIKIICVE